jgi:type I restriction-modification system DNA methylase subunit
VEAHREFTDIDGFAAVVTIDQLRANQANLNIVNYVERKSSKAVAVDLPTSLSNWEISSAEARAAANDFFELLKAVGSKK